MQPISLNLIMLSIGIASIALMIITICWQEKKEKKANLDYTPKVHCQMMRSYDQNKEILYNNIESARNLYHLQMIRERIYTFKRDYAGYQCPVILQIDTNTLRRKWKEKKTSMEVRIATMG